MVSIYLDNAATTFPKPTEVTEAMKVCMESYCVNAGRGVYPLALQADRLITDTRQKVQRLLGLSGRGKVVYAASATVALNQILFGLEWKKNDVVYTTPYEHNSVYRPLTQLKKEYGVEHKELISAVSPNTMVWDLKKVEEMFFRVPPKAIVLSHVGNVCGNVTPVEDIARLAQNYGAIVVIDGAQGGPLYPIQNRENIDFYVFSGHKTFYGPFGVAGFWTSQRQLLKPLIFGGTGTESERNDMPEDEPERYEVGSPNVLAISGLSAACDWLERTGITFIREHEGRLAKHAFEAMENWTDIKIYRGGEASLQNGIFSFNIDGYSAQSLAMVLNQEYGISVRAGLHCAPRAHEFLGTLVMGGTVRIGIGYFNTIEDIEKLLFAIERISDN